MSAPPEILARMTVAMRALRDLLQPSMPLIGFDLESTGVAPETDRIVEIGIAKLYVDGNVTGWTSLVNPGIPIPPDSTKVHHITDEMVRDAPMFGHFAQALADRMKGCGLLAYNGRRFDLRLLKAEFQRASVDYDPTTEHQIDPYSIFAQKERRDLAAAMLFYVGEEHSDSHRVAGDTASMLEVLVAQLRRYEDLPRSVEELSKFCWQKPADWIDADGRFRWQGTDAVISFGKHKGKKLREMDLGYFRYIIREDFSAEVKAICESALQGRFPERHAEAVAS